MSIEAMQQALNALEYHTMQTRPIHHTDKAIEALRQAIEQAEKQEPAGYLKAGYYFLPSNPIPRSELIPRKEWVGLTELEVKHYNNRLSGSNVAQEIESKLRERNT